jgi:PBP1b-binding outer membrane lipoprotein LpoB
MPILSRGTLVLVLALLLASCSGATQTGSARESSDVTGPYPSQPCC